MAKNVFETIEAEIRKITDEKNKQELLKALLKLKSERLNILITGATGSGKSSTINAIFGVEQATVGYGPDPETIEISKYDLDGITLWDSPGLGDGYEKDQRHSSNIISKLNEKDGNGAALIDLVLVIVDGSTRDMGTSFELINQVIIPNLQDKKRVLIAINQCDMAMKGKGWDDFRCQPNDELESFLNKKVTSIKERIYENTRVHVEPIFYSALHCYNISKLLTFILEHTPDAKRTVFANNLNRDQNVWKNNDNRENYNQKIQKTISQSAMNSLKNGAIGASTGAVIGSAIPIVGTAVGALVGGLIGLVSGWFD